MREVIAMAVPILPGKTGQWLKFSEALKNEWKDELNASRQRLGVRERTFFQSTPIGDLVLITLEGENPAEAFKKFGEEDNDFVKWMVKEVKLIHGIDLTEPMPPEAYPKLVVDTGAVKAAAV